MTTFTRIARLLLIPAAFACVMMAGDEASLTPAATGAHRIEPAAVVTMVNPVYPKIALAQRVQGAVVFDAVVAPDGTLARLTPVSGPKVLMQQAMTAARQWTYSAASIDGVGAYGSTRIRVNFQMQ